MYIQIMCILIFNIGNKSSELCIIISNTSYQWRNGFRVPTVPQRNGLNRQVEQGFSSFFATFMAYLMIFQQLPSVSAPSFSVPYFEISSILAKIWQKIKKSLVQLGFNPVLYGTVGTRNPDFGYPICHYQRVVERMMHNFYFRYSQKTRANLGKCLKDQNF